MRRLFMLFVLISALGLAVGASAQDPLWQNQIMLFGDVDAYFLWHCDFPGIGTDSAFLVLREMSCLNGIAGWECRLEQGGDVAITSIDYGLGIDADSDLLGFAVGLAEVIPYAELVVLAEIHYTSFGGEGNMWIYPNRTPSLPDVAVYVDGADPLNKIAMNPWYGDWDEPALYVNWYRDPCQVAADESSWGAVKALYR